MDGDIDDTGGQLEEHLKFNRLIRGLYRNKDRHLSVNRKNHSIGENHNCAVLFFYVYGYLPDEEGQVLMLREFKIFHRTPLSYREWSRLVRDEAMKYPQTPTERFHSFYGWRTHRFEWTPLRVGDVWIVIDEKGPRYTEFTKNSFYNEADNVRIARSKQKIHRATEHAT